MMAMEASCGLFFFEVIYVNNIVIPACASPMASARRAKAAPQLRGGFRVKPGMTYWG